MDLELGVFCYTNEGLQGVCWLIISSGAYLHYAYMGCTLLRFQSYGLVVLQLSCETTFKLFLPCFLENQKVIYQSELWIVWTEFYIRLGCLFSSEKPCMKEDNLIASQLIKCYWCCCTTKIIASHLSSYLRRGAYNLITCEMCRICKVCPKNTL